MIFLLLCFFGFTLAIPNDFPANFSSLLPIIKIDTSGIQPEREWVVAKIEIIWNDNPPNYYDDVPSGQYGYSGYVLEKNEMKFVDISKISC